MVPGVGNPNPGNSFHRFIYIRRWSGSNGRWKSCHSILFFLLETPRQMPDDLQSFCAVEFSD